MISHGLVGLIMKRDAFTHPKLYDLMSRLGCSRPTAIGYLELLWDFAKTHARAGNIGKWSDGTIAKTCEWAGESEQFIAALVDSRWICRSEEFRLVIHHWEDHMEEWVKGILARSGEAVARCPHSNRSGQLECPTGVGNRSGQQEWATPSLALPSLALPSQAPSSLPPPSIQFPEGGRSGVQKNKGKGGWINLPPLTDINLLAQWADSNGAKTMADALNIFGAAERALEVGKSPAALFARIVRGKSWHLISGEQMDRARKKLNKAVENAKPRTNGTAVAAAGH